MANLKASDVTKDLDARGARLVAVVVETPGGNLQLIQYKLGENDQAVPVFLSNEVPNMNITTHKYGNVHEPVCDIGNRNEKQPN